MKRLIATVAIAFALTGCSTKRFSIGPEPVGTLSVKDASTTIQVVLIAKGVPDATVRRGSIDGTFGQKRARILLEAPVTELVRQPHFSLDHRPYVSYDLSLAATGESKDIKSVLIPFDGQREARLFVRAFNELVARNRVLLDAEKDFEAKAAAWRASSPKPLMSEAGKKSVILAENAARENDPERTLQHYEAALETDPTWPAGNRNAALILGSMGDYGTAVRYLQRYLLLEPDGRDAAAAREKLVIWEEKARRASP